MKTGSRIPRSPAVPSQTRAAWAQEAPPATLILFYVQYALQSHLADLFLRVYRRPYLILVPAMFTCCKN